LRDSPAVWVLAGSLTGSDSSRILWANGWCGFSQAREKASVYGWEGFYIPYLYAMSDQIGANVFGFVFIYRHEKGIARAFARYSRNPVMLTSLLVILVVPFGLLLARLLGFSPTTNLFVALETIAANLCWLPPLVGMLVERKRRS